MMNFKRLAQAYCWATLTLLIFSTTVLAAPPKTLRVLSYNIHHGAGTDAKLDLPRLAAIITAAKPDLVALQEVDRRTRRTNQIDQTAELARLTGMHGQFALARPYDGGDYGQAILSRIPLATVTVHQLPGKPDEEGRIAAEVSLPATADHPAVTFVTTHLQHNDAATRKVQAATIVKLFRDRPTAVIVAGDLNAPSNSPELAAFAMWQFATPPGTATYPAEQPKKALDHVLLNPPGRFKVTTAEVLAEPVASDHRPLLVVLEWVP